MWELDCKLLQTAARGCKLDTAGKLIGVPTCPALHPIDVHGRATWYTPDFVLRSAAVQSRVSVLFEEYIQ